MEFSAFSSAGFDARSWVNGALKAQPAGSTLESHASMLITKLQTFIQKVNSELEDTSNQVMNDMPGIIRSVDVLAQEVGTLKDRMTMLREDIEQVEKETAESIGTLMILDNLKTRMEETTSALQEAGNWSALSSDIEAAFDTGDVKKIWSTLLGMQRSLMVLCDVPDYADRLSMLTARQARFEAIITPLLIDAFTTHNADFAKELIAMFGDINRKKEVIGIFKGCHKTPILSLWSSLMEQGGASDPHALTVHLRTFHDRLERFVREESPWAARLFPDCNDIIAQVLAGILTERTPSMAQVLAGYAHHTPDTLDKVLAPFKLTEDFARRMKFKEAHILEVLFAAFIDYQVEFGPLLAKSFAHALTGLPSNYEGLNADETVDKVSWSVSQLGRFGEKCSELCLELTGGMALDGASYAMHAAVARIAESLLPAVSRIRALATASQSEDVDGVNVWMHFHSAFRLIQCAGVAYALLDQFESNFRQHILAHVSTGKDDEVHAGYILFDFLKDRSKLRQTFISTLTHLRQGQPLFGEARKALTAFNVEAHRLAYEIALVPVKARLHLLHTHKVWKEEGTEDDEFSLSPLQYISQIGEHLISLPQQLEPFLLADSQYVLVAFRSFPYALGSDTDSTPASGVDVNVADAWLLGVARGCMEEYISEMLRIPLVSSMGARHLAADIDYLCNVLSALDAPPSKKLLQLHQLLALPKEEVVPLLAEPGDRDPLLTQQVAKMRGIKA